MTIKRLDQAEPFDATGRKKLGAAMIHCVVPMIDTGRAKSALAVLDCVRILNPRCETGLLEALAHYCLDDYLGALQVLDSLDGMPARALAALCQRAMGEASWLGIAERVYESGDGAAIELLMPWMDEHLHPAPLKKKSPADLQVYSFTPMRA